MMIQGIPASAGIAVGPVVLYEPAHREIAREPVAPEAAADEWKRLEVALYKARVQIADLREVTSRRVGPDEAAIFDAHLLVLEDEVLLDDMRARILDQHANAEAAVFDAVQVYRDQLLAIDDDYLRSRAADLEDIAGRVLACLRGVERGLGAVSEPSVVAAKELLPSDTAGLDPDLTLALVTEEGGPTSHTAILARQLGIPAVVGARGLLATLREAQSEHGGTVAVAVDGGRGVVEVAADPAVYAHYATLRDTFSSRREQLKHLVTLPAVTPDGHHVELAANIGKDSDAPDAAEKGAMGVGLFRTEFLFLDRAAAPTEDEQVAAYVAAARPFTAGSVIVRTLDVGGDKTIPYLPQEAEENPFLGLRGIRLCLADHFRPVFKTQLRALLRAVAQGANLRVMFPMVNTVEEMRAAKALLREAADELEAEGVPARAALERLAVGAMIETPAAAYTADLLAAECDFFSIGTNDLTQYVLAVDRLNANVAPLYEPLCPAVLRAIYAAVNGAHSKGRRIGMCGELAANPRATPLLLGMGLDEFSVAPSSLGEIKQLIRACPIQRARDVMYLVYQLASPEEIAQVLDGAVAEILAAEANQAG